LRFLFSLVWNGKAKKSKKAREKVKTFFGATARQCKRGRARRIVWNGKKKKSKK